MKTREQEWPEPATKKEPPKLEGLALLRAPFPPNQISKLPKESKAQIDARKANRDIGINCQICGGWHHKHAVHLDYVGHAALTDRLLDADPHWQWEPLAMHEGLPVMDSLGGMWIKLTVCGVTRLGYGHAGEKRGGDAIKEVIGDAMRNAAMRFGAALDLWHKGDLHVEDEKEPETVTADEAAELADLCAKTGRDAAAVAAHYKIPSLLELSRAQFATVKQILSKPAPKKGE